MAPLAAAIGRTPNSAWISATSGLNSDGDAALQAARKSEKDWPGTGFAGLR